MCLGRINLNNAESLLYRMVIIFCRRREIFDLREGPLIVSMLTSVPCSVFMKKLKPLGRNLRMSNRISSFSAVDVRELNHLARLSELNNFVRSRTEIFWFYSFLWISMLSFFEGLSDVLTALIAVERSEKSQDIFIPHHLITVAHLCLNQYKSKNNPKFWVLYLKHFNIYIFFNLSEPWDDSDSAPKGLMEKTWGNDTEWGPITCVNNFHEANLITVFPHQWTVALVCKVTGTNCKMLR